LSSTKSSQDPSSEDPREYVVYVFFFVAVTAFMAVWTRWSVQGAGLGIATEVFSGFYCADWLIARKRQ